MLERLVIKMMNASFWNASFWEKANVELYDNGSAVIIIETNYENGMKAIDFAKESQGWRVKNIDTIPLLNSQTILVHILDISSKQTDICYKIKTSIHNEIATSEEMRAKAACDPTQCTERGCTMLDHGHCIPEKELTWYN